MPTEETLQRIIDQGTGIRESLDAIFRQGEQMLKNLEAPKATELDARQRMSATYAAQRAANKTSAAQLH